MPVTVSGTSAFYSFIFTLPWGLIGHTSSLITFSSKNLRRSSTGLLFICLTVSDTLYLLMSIRDILVQAFQLPILQSAALCRFRQFIINFSSTSSAWLLVLIAFDRLIRARWPYKQARICTLKVAAYSVAVVCICATLSTSHVLQLDFSYTDILSNWCGPPRFPETSYAIFYFNAGAILQSAITYICPACLMSVCMIATYSKIRAQQTLVVTSMRRDKLKRQMFILMFTSVACFTCCTVPYAIHRIIYLRLGTTSATQMEVSILSIFLLINYSYNFYIHCLTSTLFRQEFFKQLKKFYIWCMRESQQNHINSIHPLAATMPTPA